jgi:hypothetical protein
LHVVLMRLLQISVTVQTEALVSQHLLQSRVLLNRYMGYWS